MVITSKHDAFKIKLEMDLFGGLVNKADVLTHETSWIHHISSNFTIDFDQALSTDLFGLSIGQSVLESVSQENDSWK